MLEEFQQVLHPQTLLDVVPKEILRAMMQGFFFGHRAGMLLVYDNNHDPDTNK